MTTIDLNSVQIRQRAALTIPAAAPEAFHLLAKPTGAICNLDCAYCFFLDKEIGSSRISVGDPRYSGTDTEQN
jgi:sulfatase maturation enzyme AslB (radical SAM superfamily)